VFISRAWCITEQEFFAPPPSIRLYASITHSDAQINQAISTIQGAIDKALN
jgi:hypothetical protein